MRTHVRFLITISLFTVLVPLDASGQLFRRFRERPNPQTFVPKLLKTLQADPDEAHRAEAAEELRNFEAPKYPQIVPSLVFSLRKDPSSSVRSAAAESLGRIRPISREVGYALEQARATDDSMRVRWAARTALWQYHLVGYRSQGEPKASPPIGQQTGEPPLADPPGRAGTPSPMITRPEPPQTSGYPARTLKPRVPVQIPRVPATSRPARTKTYPPKPTAAKVTAPAFSVPDAEAANIKAPIIEPTPMRIPIPLGTTPVPAPSKGDPVEGPSLDPPA